MNLRNFPLCCTAHVITGFGGTTLTEGVTLEQTKKQIKEFIKYEASWHNNHAMFTATTNSDQKIANEALTELGFKHSEWVSKTQHPQTKIRLWYIAIEDLL